MWASRYPALAAAAQNHQPNAAVGDEPNPWNPFIDEYQHLDIIQLIVFYNNGFGIDIGDSVHVKLGEIKYVLGCLKNDGAKYYTLSITPQRVHCWLW